MQSNLVGLHLRLLPSSLCPFRTVAECLPELPPSQLPEMLNDAPNAMELANSTVALLLLAQKQVRTCGISSCRLRQLLDVSVNAACFLHP